MSELFCHLPWTEMLVQADRAMPCCKFTTKSQIAVDGYDQHPEIKQVRQEILSGQVPKQCQACVYDEKHFGHSYRLLHNQFNPASNYNIVDQGPLDCYQDIQVLVSDTCNLKCTSCLSSSYVRSRELFEMGIFTNPPQHFQRNPNIDALLNCKFKKITLLGGEPFVDKETFWLLERIVDQGRSQDIVVSLNSNMTAIQQHQMDFLSKNFKRVQIKASIDGIGAVNEYLRYPSRWHDVDQNLQMCQTYDNALVVITSTLSNLSMLRFYEVLEYAHERKVQDIFVNNISNPSQMAPTIIPRQLLPELTQRYQHLASQSKSPRTQFVIETCLNILNNADDTVWSSSQAWYQQHDQHRGNSFLTVFPELAPYV